jgi:hypothetical protein
MKIRCLKSKYYDLEKNVNKQINLRFEYFLIYRDFVTAKLRMCLRIILDDVARISDRIKYVFLLF